jgi:hypothetical protein
MKQISKYMLVRKVNAGGRGETSTKLKSFSKYAVGSPLAPNPTAIGVKSTLSFEQLNAKPSKAVVASKTFKVSAGKSIDVKRSISQMALRDAAPVASKMGSHTKGLAGAGRSSNSTGQKQYRVGLLDAGAWVGRLSILVEQDTYGYARMVETESDLNEIGAG